MTPAQQDLLEKHLEFIKQERQREQHMHQTYGWSKPRSALVWFNPNGRDCHTVREIRLLEDEGLCAVLDKDYRSYVALSEADLGDFALVSRIREEGT